MKVRIISTTIEGVKNVETEATQWEVLKNELSREIPTINEMKAVSKSTTGRTSLELADTPLPTEDFTLFLTPVKVKSGKNTGELSYKECKAYIKKERTKSTKANDHFGNYTRFSTAKMNELISSWKGNKTQSKAKVAKTTTETISETSQITKVAEQTQLDRVEAKLDSVISLLKDGVDEPIVCNAKDPVVEEVKETIKEVVELPTDDELDELEALMD